MSKLLLMNVGGSGGGGGPTNGITFLDGTQMLWINTTQATWL